MKYLCVLLAFLVLTLSVQPVCASVSSEDTCCSESSCTEAADNPESDSGDDCTGTCNPFQSCNCCVFSALPVPFSLFSIKTLSIYLDVAWGSFKCPFVQAPVLSFWQPPKLF